MTLSLSDDEQYIGRWLISGDYGASKRIRQGFSYFDFDCMADQAFLTLKVDDLVVIRSAREFGWVFFRDTLYQHIIFTPNHQFTESKGVCTQFILQAAQSMFFDG